MNTSLPGWFILFLFIYPFPAQPAASSGGVWLELMQAGNRAYDRGKYAEAAEHYNSALEESKRSGQDERLEATAANNLGVVFIVLKEYGSARKLFGRALAIRERVLGSRHPDVGTVLHNFGELYRGERNYPQAEEYYRRSLAIWEESLGKNHVSMATVLCNLGELYRVQKRFPEAEDFYLRAIAVLETSGENIRELATSRHNLAILYQDMGDYVAAEPMFRLAVKDMETALGPDHPNIATALSNLAWSCRFLGRYEQAEDFLRRSLEIQERAFGDTHPSIAASLDKLAAVFSDMGKVDEAARATARARKLRSAFASR